MCGLVFGWYLELTEGNKVSQVSINNVLIAQLLFETCFFFPEGLLTKMSELTVPELDKCLRDLVNWQRFAVHLPQIDQTDIRIIEKNNRDDVVDQKLALYEAWLKVCPDASWDNVIHALESVKENTLASKIKGKFPITAQKEQNLKQHEVTDKAKDEASVPVSKDVVAKLQKLHGEFVLLTKDVKAEVTRRVENNDKVIERVCRLYSRTEGF